MKLKIFISASLLASLFMSGAAYALTFKIATISPDGSYWMQNMRTAAELIKQKTSGRVEFKFYPGGVMGDDANVMRKIRLRQLQGAALSSAALAEIYPDIQLYNLILKFRNLDEVDFVRSHMDTALKKGLEQHGFIPLGFVEVGMVYVMSLSPIQSIDQFRAQKVWVPNGNDMVVAAMRAFDISPIPLPLRDVLVGLQTGMINVAAAPPTAAIALQWHTKVKYVTDFPLLYSYGVFALDKSTFARLSEDDQQIVRTVMSEFAGNVDARSRQDNLQAIEALRQQGISFVDLNDKEAERLLQAIAVVNDNMEKNDRLSIDNVTQLNLLLKDYRQH